MVPLIWYVCFFLYFSFQLRPPTSPRYKNPCWVEQTSVAHSNSSVLRCLPYFILAGFTKCGTTSLFAEFCSHSQMLSGDTHCLKELRFWDTSMLSKWKHDDVMIWKWLPHYWPFVRGFYRWPVKSPRKGPIIRTFEAFFVASLDTVEL